MSELVMRDALSYYALGEHQTLVVNERTRQRCGLQRQGVPVLQHCDRLATLDEHARRIAETIPGFERAGGDILKLLQQCRDNGLLVDEASLIERLGGSSSRQRDPLGWMLAVFTCDQPVMLQRVLDECRATLPNGQPPEKVLIMDDSRDPARRKENMGVVDAWARATGLVAEIWDRGARREVARTLAQSHPAHADALHWLLAGEVGESRAATIGQARNLALLLTAGQRMLMMDDDCLLQPRRRPGDAGVVIGTRAARAWPYADWASLEAHSTPASLNPFEEHLAMLGISPAALLDTQAGAGGNLLPSKVEADTAARLMHTSRVRLTANAVMGDPGTGGMSWLYTREPENAAAIARYLAGTSRQASLPRMFWRGREHSTLCADEAVMTTTLTGVDNTREVPCLLPLGRSEDFTLGVVSAGLDRTSLAFTFDWALPHQPEPMRTWRRAALDDVNITPPPEAALAQVIEGLMPGETLRALDARRQSLVRGLLELTEYGDQDLTAHVEATLLPEWTGRLKHLRDNQLTLNQPDAPFHADAEVLKNKISQSIARPLVLSPDWLARFREQAKHYARGLEAWPAAWAHAKAHREELLSAAREREGR